MKFSQYFLFLGLFLSFSALGKTVSVRVHAPLKVEKNRLKILSSAMDSQEIGGQSCLVVLEPGELTFQMNGGSLELQIGHEWVRLSPSNQEETLYKTWRLPATSYESQNFGSGRLKSTQVSFHIQKEKISAETLCHFD